MNHTHKHKRKNKLSLNDRIKRLFSSRFIIVLGAIFLLIGIYYSLNESFYNIYNKVLEFFKPTNTQVVFVPTGSGFINLLLYFLPVIIILVLTILYARKYAKITFPLTLISTIYLITIQIKIFSNIFTGGCYYSSSFMASVFLLIPIFLLLLSVLLHRKLSILIFSFFYFYITLFLYSAGYIVLFVNLSFFIIIFSIIIYWIGKKIGKQSINLTNFIFVIIFLTVFFIRKLVVQTKPEFLVEYISYSILFYILFYVIGIITTFNKEQPLPKWMLLLYNWLNLLYFLISTSFIFIKYFSFEYLWILVSALLLLNLIVIYLFKRKLVTAWLLPYYFTAIFLSSLILPTLFKQDYLFLFTSIFSVLLLIYAISNKSKTAWWISRFALVIAVTLYLLSWIVTYFPTLITSTRLIKDSGILLEGVICGIVMCAVLATTNFQICIDNFSGTKKWYSGHSYIKLIYAFLLISLFLTLAWIVFVLIFQLTDTVIHSSVGLFISGSLYFIIQIMYYAGKNPSFKKSLLYLAFIHVLIYPFLLGWGALGENFIHLGELNMSGILLHYFAIILLVILTSMTVRRIYERNPKTLFMKQGVQVITVVYLVFFLCAEYDNLSILVAYLINSTSTGNISVTTIIGLNQYIPYTVIGWLLSVCLFIVSVLKKRLFLRNCALAIFLLVLIKVYSYDFQTLDPGERSVVFYVTGLFLIGLALVYQKLPQNVYAKESKKIKHFRDLGKKEEPVSQEKS